MSWISQQVFGSASRPRAVVFAVLAAIPGLIPGAGCEGPPARSKPWRHADQRPDPRPEPRSRVLAERESRLAAAAAPEKTLRIHLPTDPVHLHPLLEPSLWGQRITRDTVFETLLRYRDDPGGGPGELTGGIAESFTVSPSGREIRLQLREDLRCHDGGRLTAVDVQFSIDSARHPRVDAEHHRGALASVTSVLIAGPHTVRIQLSEPDGYVLRELAEIPILPERVYDGQLARGVKSGDLVGSGPYRVQTWNEDGVVLERWDEYWGEQPSIETIVFAREGDAAEALRLAKDGALDFIPDLIPAHREQSELPAMKARFQVLDMRPAEVRLVLMNHRTTPFADARVRRAVDLLVDRKGLAKASRGARVPAAGLIWPGGPGDGAGRGDVARAPAQATRLLEQAGWKDDKGEGVRTRNGERLMITVLVTPEEHPERDAVLEALRGAGFLIDSRVGPAAVLSNRLRAGDFDLAFLDWRGPRDRDLGPLIGTRGRLNYGAFSDEGVDRLLEEMRRTWDPTQRAVLARSLDRVITERAPVVVLTAPAPLGLLDRRVRGATTRDGWIELRSLTLEDASTP